MADGLILAYDSSDPASLEAIETKWLDEAKQHGAHLLQSGNILLLGTKSDLLEGQGVVQRANQLARELGFMHGTCSAARGEGVEATIDKFCSDVQGSHAFLQKWAVRAAQDAVEVEEEDVRQGNCCPVEKGLGAGGGCFDKMIAAMRCWEGFAQAQTGPTIQLAYQPVTA